MSQNCIFFGCAEARKVWCCYLQRRFGSEATFTPGFSITARSETSETICHRSRCRQALPRDRNNFPTCPRRPMMAINKHLPLAHRGCNFFSSTAVRAANDGWSFCSRGPIRWCGGFGAATFVWKRYRQFSFRKKTQLLIFCVLFVTGFLQVGDTNPWSFLRRFVYSYPC